MSGSSNSPLIGLNTTSARSRVLRANPFSGSHFRQWEPPKPVNSVSKQLYVGLCTSCARATHSYDGTTICPACLQEQRAGDRHVRAEEGRTETGSLRWKTPYMTAGQAGLAVEPGQIASSVSVSVSSGPSKMADSFLGKRKAAQSLPVELQRAAKPIFHIQEATALPTSSRTTASVSSGPDLVAPCDVYQTGEDLYSALSSALQSFYDSCASQQQQQRLPYVRFRGMYSIVADPSVPQRKRVTLVSTELRKFVKYPHSCGDEVCASFMTTEKWTGTYQCDCSRGRAYPSHFPSTSQPTSASQSTSQSPASIPSPASSAPPLSQSSAVSASSAKAIRRTQSNLSHWILNTSRKTKPAASSELGAAPVTFRSGTGQADTMPGCGGRLYIVAEEDESHPLGKAVMGQRITVIVEHPRWN